MVFIRLIYLVGKVNRGGIPVKGEVQCENYDVGQWGDDAQHHSVPQLEWQHGVNGEDDEEEERHLETEKGIIHLFWLICRSKSVVKGGQLQGILTV